MTAIQVRSEALPSLEKARMLLERCRSTQECQKIRALAQAVASCAATEQARDEAAAIVLLAKARIGELTREMTKVTPQVSGRAGGKGSSRAEQPSKSAALAAEGLSRKDAAECESGRVDAYAPLDLGALPHSEFRSGTDCHEVRRPQGRGPLPSTSAPCPPAPPPHRTRCARLPPPRLRPATASADPSTAPDPSRAPRAFLAQRRGTTQRLRRTRAHFLFLVSKVSRYPTGCASPGLRIRGRRGGPGIDRSVMTQPRTRGGRRAHNPHASA